MRTEAELERVTQELWAVDAAVKSAHYYVQPKSPFVSTYENPWKEYLICMEEALHDEMRRRFQ